MQLDGWLAGWLEQSTFFNLYRAVLAGIERTEFILGLQQDVQTLNRRSTRVSNGGDTAHIH